MANILPRCLVDSLLVCLMVAPLHAGDWPQWGGTPHRNMASEEKRLPSRFDPGKKRRTYLGYEPDTGKNIRWIARLGSENYSSPTIAGGRVYIGTNDEDIDDPRFEATRGGVLLCLDEQTGKLRWRLVVPRLEIDRTKVSEDFDDMNLGICSTAMVDGNRVYLVSNRCEVLCLDVDGLQDGNDEELAPEDGKRGEEVGEAADHGDGKEHIRVEDVGMLAVAEGDGAGFEDAGEEEHSLGV